MAITNHLIKNILAEIEKGDVDFMAGKLCGEVDQEIEDKILGSSMDDIPDYKPVEHDPRYHFYVGELIERRDVGNRIHHVDFYQPIESGNVLKRAFRKMVRRLIAPIMEVVVLEQNRFNAAVAAAVTMMCDNDTVMAEFVREQEKLNQEVRMLRREVEMLRKKNVEARMEMISSRKQFHRDIVLLRETLEDKPNAFR